MNAVARDVVIEDLSSLPHSKDEAILLRQKFYFTGRPCMNGHLSKRYTSVGVCVECQRLRMAGQVKAAQTPWGMSARISYDELFEPGMWRFDGDLTRREPVVLNGRVVRYVGWIKCIKCREPFFSEDVKGIRSCDPCKKGRQWVRDDFD